MADAVRFDGFREALAAAPDVAGAWAAMTAFADACGYHSVDYGLARLRTPRPRSAEDFTVVQHLSTFDWSAHYAERGYQAVDRITRAALSAVAPYRYDEVWRAPPECERQREMEGEMFHARMQSLLAPAAPAERADPLSQRERECLSWAARGKTAWETSRILTVSESAVKKHLATAAANHSPLFFADEAALPTGVRALAHLTADYMEAR